MLCKIIISNQKLRFGISLMPFGPWVRGLMAINVECEFRGRGSIPSVCQMLTLGTTHPKRWPPPRLAMCH